MDAKRPTCRHCRARVASCARGLCERCYCTPDVRKRYPATSDRWRRGLGNVFRNAPLPDRPTDAPPGSPEKVAVLKQRVEAGVALWHPGDAVAGNRMMKRRITTLAAEIRTLALKLAGEIASMPDRAESPVLARVELAMQETVAKLRSVREAVAAMPTLSIAPEEGDGEDAA